MGNQQQLIIWVNYGYTTVEQIIDNQFVHIYG